MNKNLSIVIFHPTGRKELVAYDIPAEQAVKIRGDLSYYETRETADHACIVTNAKAEFIFAL